MDAKKTLHNLKQRYWWPNMRTDCNKYVRSCHKCQVLKRRTVNAYGLLQQLPIPPTPWEIVSADHNPPEQVYQSCPSAHLRPYFKRDADVMQNNTSDEENDSSAENRDPAEDHQEVSVTTEPSSSRNHLLRNPRPPKRFEQYVS
ncbi:hypothetical protein TNCV_462681 [Trichonephila clavipes]|nr:hypothetical protein TNCV_462681 [Trichonephila clavipes]